MQASNYLAWKLTKNNQSGNLAFLPLACSSEAQWASAEAVQERQMENLLRRLAVVAHNSGGGRFLSIGA
jgi:hypothetical protein